MVKKIVTGATARKRGYRLGTGADIATFRAGGMNRAEARIMSKAAVVKHYQKDDQGRYVKDRQGKPAVLETTRNPVVKKMLSDRKKILKAFNKKADPDWSDGQRRYYWNKRIREVYAKNKLWTVRSAGETKKVGKKTVAVHEKSPWALYRLTLKRLAVAEGTSPEEYERQKIKTPTFKDSITRRKDKARARIKAIRKERGL